MENTDKPKGVLDLYKAAHDAAFETLDMQTEAEIQAFGLRKFKEANFRFTHDFNKFYTYLGDTRILLTKLQREKLPSELAHKEVS